MSTPSAPGSPAPSNPAPRPSLFVRLANFWQRVTEGLELGQLWKQFHADARASYRLYQKDYEAQSPSGTRKAGFWHTAQGFAWAILEKLSPARRVLLLLGFVLLIFPGSSFSHHNDEGRIEVIEFDFHFVGGGLLFILLMLEIADRVVMKRDLEIARDIQRWLLPAAPPEVPGMAIAFATRPANTVAGDYYDVFPRPTSDPGAPHFLIAVADVAGKSIPAALLMATFQASLKTLSSVPCSLVELVTGMNRYANSNSQGGLRFTTAFLAEFDPSNRELTYVNAGHNTPILRRSSGTIERLANGGLPFGINLDASYDETSIALQPGDWLLIFTDGLVEALNSQDQEYGEEKLIALLQAGTTSTPEQLLRRIMSDLDAYVGATPQHDDVTCLLVKVV